MAGLRFDDALPSLINSNNHAIIDYIHAGTNFIVGALLLRRNKFAAGAAFALGASVL